MNANPLAFGAAKRAPARDGRSLTTAAMQRVAALNLGHGQIGQQLDLVDYAVPAIGSLLNKKNVTQRDVVKATADAVGAGKLTAEQGVQFIMNAPKDEAEIRGWLRGMYVNLMRAGVALHGVKRRMLAVRGAAA